MPKHTIKPRFRSPYLPSEDERALLDGETPLGIVKRSLQNDIGPSFDKAWREMRNGNPRNFVLKAGGVGIGAVLMADGIYNLIEGFDQEVDDLFLPSAVGRNNTRMFAGAVEVLTGAAALYLALTKGPKGLAGASKKGYAGLLAGAGKGS